MAKVLYIKANAKKPGESRTYRIADAFVERYRELHPEDEMITLDLYREGVDFLPLGRLDEVRRNPGAGKDHPILRYAYQFQEADRYVVAAPLWNLGVPAILKAYIDYVAVSGITFKYTADGPVGLCRGRAVHITSRGGEYSEGPAASLEMGDRYLRTIFGFMGVTDFTTIAAEGLDIQGNDVEAIVAEAAEKARKLAEVF